MSATLDSSNVTHPAKRVEDYYDPEAMQAVLDVDASMRVHGNISQESGARIITRAYKPRISRLRITLLGYMEKRDEWMFKFYRERENTKVLQDMLGQKIEKCHILRSQNGGRFCLGLMSGTILTACAWLIYYCLSH